MLNYLKHFLRIMCLGVLLHNFILCEIRIQTEDEYAFIAIALFWIPFNGTLIKGL